MHNNEEQFCEVSSSTWARTSLKMEIVQETHNQHWIKDVCDNHAFSAEPPKGYDSFGEPIILPRVGDQYQVDLPPLITRVDALCSNKNAMDANRMDVVLHKFLVGLPLSIMWVAKELDKGTHKSTESPSNSVDISDKKESSKSECIQQIKPLSEGCEPKLEFMDVASNVGMSLAESGNLPLECEMKIELQQRHRGQGYLGPGFSGDTWNDIEEASFVLGLYIFGKNLVQVQNFVGSKKMGDVLCFYYGKFYRSESYCKWSECRKMRSRKCIYGQRIFTGLRQQELLSRLSSHVSDECHCTLLEVSKTFREGKMPLEEYVFTLKATVGLSTLVSAVGIGKGKEDLTGVAVEPLKSDQAVSVHPEIPVGKACSTLTPFEIIKFLSGNYRLSKARSNDLFWEAVWPRLLARGWHSEQPTDHIYAAGSKHSLVFLIPGVKKFSRRKLVKGRHYFDSVSDVLYKVASDPGLLELEIGAEKEENSKEENECCNGSYGTKLENHESANQQCHCYIKPCTPSHVADFMKFTVVDTSLANGGTFRVRELRTLPVEMNSCNFPGSSDESEEESYKESQSSAESDSANSVCSDRVENNCSKPTTISSNLGVFPKTHASKSDSIDNGIILYGSKARMPDDMRSREITKEQKNKRKRPGQKAQGVPLTKQRRRLNPCSHADAVSTTSTMGCLKMKQVESNRCRGNLDLHSKLVPSQEVPQEQKLSSPSSSRGSPTISSEVIGSANHAIAEKPNDEVEPRTLIDLNLSVHLDVLTDQSSVAEMTERKQDQLTIEAGYDGELKPYAIVPSSQQLPTMNARRHSTRNRPLTTKALEALACGFLSTAVKRKRRGSSRPKTVSRLSHRAHGQKRTTTKGLDSSIVNSKAEERGVGAIEQASGLIQMEMGPDLGSFVQ